MAGVEHHLQPTPLQQLADTACMLEDAGVAGRLEQVDRRLHCWRYGSSKVRLVALSPHLDDAALSIGATLHRLARAGAEVTVLTVMAGDPSSSEAPSPWDANAGFKTSGDAAVARRAEDERACAVLGVRPVWLPFTDGSYSSPGVEERASSAIGSAIADAERVLVPGFPLEHPDHVWLTRLALTRLAPGPRIGLYREQPYALRKLGRPRVVEGMRDLLSDAPRWRVARCSARDRRAKLRACRAYVSQRPLLRSGERLALTRIAVDDAFRGGEYVAWLDGSHPPSHFPA